jgi:hypothetical protein
VIVLQNAWACLPVEVRATFGPSSTSPITINLNRPDANPTLVEGVLGPHREITPTPVSLTTDSSASKRAAKRLPVEPQSKKIKGEDTLSQITDTQFNDWMSDPLSFIFGVSHGPNRQVVASSYKLLTDLESSGVDLVRARLLKVLFHYIQIKISSKNTEAIASIIMGSGVVKCSLDTVKKKNS